MGEKRAEYGKMGGKRAEYGKIDLYLRNMILVFRYRLPGKCLNTKILNTIY